jgi:AraC family transcriptional regulator
MTLVFHPAGEKHAQRFGDDRVLSFNIDLGRPSALDRSPTTQLLDRSIECRGDASAATAWRLWCEFKSPAPDTMVMEALMNELFPRLCQSGTHAGRRQPSWVNALRQTIESRFSEPWQLRTLAAEVGIHPVHLATTFRRATGYSVGEYVRRCRLQYAQTRLRDARATLSSIALDAGFADQSHFTRTFRRFVGVTPANFRRTLTLVQDGADDLDEFAEA